MISEEDTAVAEQVDDVFRLPENDPLLFSVLGILPGYFQKTPIIPMK